MLSLAACYDPATRDCTVRCSAPTECASGQHCVGGWCAAASVNSCARPPDMSPDPNPTDPDAASVQNPPPDAIDICEQGCSKGTCINGVCTIDCSAPGSCLTDVICPINLPCHVICGDGSCTHHVNCGMSLACTVECTGDNACGDQIQCSTYPCNVTCTGAGACKRKIACPMSCSCDVTCSGIGSCAEISDCPLDTQCRVGNGCTSQVGGCNTCP
jgi:hypothetical protein